MFTLNCKSRLVVIEKPIVMGILNITPDSFYSGSRVMNPALILGIAQEMITDGATIIDTGWKYKKMQPRTENLYASIYSAIGIDWRKELTNTPSKRAYRYVDVLGATEFVSDDEITDLFA